MSLRIVRACLAVLASPVLMLAVAPADFTLLAPDGQRVSCCSGTGQVTAVIFVAARCPMSNAFNARLNSLYKQFAGQVRFLVVDSNVNESAEEVAGHARAMGYDFPVYRDIDNHAADALGARATPESFVIDRSGVLSYRGYIEDGANPERTKNPALRLAIEAALSGKPAPTPETHGRGCAIRRTHPLTIAGS